MTPMFRIRDFARFTRVSVKMLRHYDEIGLLRPGRVDPLTAYRYYSANQVPRLNRIIALKDLGFSLEQIAGLLKEDLSPDEIRGALKLRRVEIREQLRRDQVRLAQVEARLEHLEREQHLPPYDVVLREVSAQWVAALRQLLEADAPLAPLFDEVEAFAARHQARAALSPLTVFYDTGQPEEQLDLEVAVPVARPLPSGERIKVHELPGVADMACVVYEGSYERGLGAFHALWQWMEANLFEVAGPWREVYLRFNADHAEQLRLPRAFLADHESEFVTEIQFPVVSRGR